MIEIFTASFVCAVFVLLPFIARTYWIYSQLKKNGLKTEGEITAYEEYTNNKGQKSFFPVIKFRTNLNKEIHHRTLYGLNVSQYIEKGSKVEIIYSENRPDRFMLEHHNPFKIDNLILMGLVATLLISVLVLLL